MRRLLLGLMLCANTIRAQEHLENTLESTPEMIEIRVETDKKAQGFRAEHHKFQIQLNTDPMVNGRLTLGFQYNLSHSLTLNIPVSFDSPVLGQWAGKAMGIYGARIVDQWALLGGFGLKIRLSEWVLKSSFYIEPVVQAGYYKQMIQIVQKEMSDSIRIRPGLYLGFETVFDTGLVIGVKVGAERAFDHDFREKPLSYAANNFSVVPMFGLGYAW
jgi:hypothetical protein